MANPLDIYSFSIVWGGIELIQTFPFKIDNSFKLKQNTSLLLRTLTLAGWVKIVYIAVCNISGA